MILILLVCFVATTADATVSTRGRSGAVTATLGVTATLSGGNRGKSTLGPCASDPCRHGGTCKESRNKKEFKCKCLVYFTGKTCETGPEGECIEYCPNTCSPTSQLSVMRSQIIKNLGSARYVDDRAILGVYIYRDDKGGKFCSCPSGFWGPVCDIKCPRGHFGPLCASLCPNCKKQECSRVDGKCTLPGCLDGFEGEYCRQEVKCETNSPSCQHGFCRTDALNSSMQARVKDWERWADSSMDQQCICADGYKGAFCRKRCTKKNYGIMCKRKMEKSCRYCLNPLLRCSHKTGRCYRCSRGHKPHCKTKRKKITEVSDFDTNFPEKVEVELVCELVKYEEVDAATKSGLESIIVSLESYKEETNQVKATLQRLEKATEEAESTLKETNAKVESRTKQIEQLTKETKALEKDKVEQEKEVAKLESENKNLDAQIVYLQNRIKHMKDLKQSASRRISTSSSSPSGSLLSLSDELYDHSLVRKMEYEIGMGLPDILEDSPGMVDMTDDLLLLQGNLDEQTDRLEMENEELTRQLDTLKAEVSRHAMSAMSRLTDAAKEKADSAKGKLDAAKAGAREKVDSAKEKLDSAKAGAKEKMDAAKEAARDKVDSAKDKLKLDAAKEKFDSAKAGAKEKMDAAKEAAREKVDSAKEKLKIDAAKGKLDSAKDAAKGKFDSTKEKFDSAKAGAKEKVDAAKAKVDSAKAGAKEKLDAAKERAANAKANVLGMFRSAKMASKFGKFPRRRDASPPSPTVALDVHLELALPPDVQAQPDLDGTIVSAMRATAEEFQSEVISGLQMDKNSIRVTKVTLPEELSEDKDIAIPTTVLYVLPVASICVIVSAAVMWFCICRSKPKVVRSNHTSCMSAQVRRIPSGTSKNQKVQNRQEQIVKKRSGQSLSRGSGRSNQADKLRVRSSSSGSMRNTKQGTISNI